MPISNPLFTRQRAKLLVALFVFLGAVYMLSYSARIESGDSLQLFDAAGSLVQFSDFLLDLSAGNRLPQTFDRLDYYPLTTADAEPLQVALAAPLFWLAERLPGVGLVHTVWLFNVLVCAAAGCVLFLYAVTLGYNEHTAALGALALGLCTIVFPYSKSFFREPLVLLLVLLAGLLAERWRMGHYHSLLLMMSMILASVGIVLAKAAAGLALPALLLIVLPSLRQVNRRVLIALAVGTALVIGVFFVLALFGDALGVGQRYNPFSRLTEGRATYLPIALHTYLVSIGGSVWGTSPIVLLAVPGGWLLFRADKPRYIGVALVLTLTFAVGYALVSGTQWFGGLSWPPRFLVPVIPFLMIVALPVIDRVLRPAPPRWLVGLAVVLTLYSLWVQICSVSLWWGDYTRALPPEAKGLLEWGGGLNLIRYVRWVLIPTLWASIPLDFVWVRLNLSGWAAAFGSLALLCAVALRGLLRDSALSARRWTPFIAALPISFAVMTGFGLRAIYDDSLYDSWNTALGELLPIIDHETAPGDLIILSNLSYQAYFLNYGKLSHARVISLPAQPGDQPSPDQPPQVISANPDVLLTNLSLPFVHSLADVRPCLWLLENAGPDIPWGVRPVERFMAAHYYPIRVIETAPQVRLIEYSTVDAPDPYAFRGAEILTDLVYDDALRLVGYNLPLGTTYAPGDALPISLYWRADRRLTQDYRVAWFLRTLDGAPVVQAWDSRPGGDFSLTSMWQIGTPLWDNRALRLPLDIAPGEYRLWVKVYALSDSTPVDLVVVGSETLDGTIGVLPTMITITEGE